MTRDEEAIVKALDALGSMDYKALDEEDAKTVRMVKQELEGVVQRIREGYDDED